MEMEEIVEKKLTQKQADYLEVENHCCLCGTELIFEHNGDETGQKLIEQAHCPCCKVQLKEREFTLQ